MKNTQELIKNLDFDTIKVFSICRNNIWKLFQAQVFKRYIKHFKIHQTNLAPKDYIPNKHKIDLLEEQLWSSYWIDDDLIIEDNGIISHPFVEIISVIDKKQDEAKSLENILNIECKDNISTMCWPIYREGILFYKNNDFLGKLLICFDCLGLKYGNQRLEADIKLYDSLKLWFNNLGCIIGNTNLEERDYIRSVLSSIK